MTLETSPSLLDRLRRPDDAAAWGRFVDLYAPLVHVWGKRAGLQDADAADLVQDVFLLLRDKMPSFRYDPSRRFRGWLRTVALNCWRARQRKRRPDSLPPDHEPAEPDPAAEFWERDYRQYLTARALAIMQNDFEPHVWQACWLTTADGLPAAEVAQLLGMSVGAVYTARCRVLARLRFELAGLAD